jgi:uncharacterized protein
VATDDGRAVLPRGRLPALGTTFSLITKVTRWCNLRCTYCNEWEDTKTVMSFRTLAALTRGALEYPDTLAVNFIWHGGEPLVRGREFYDRALYLQDRCRRKGQVIKNSIQTNGTLVNEKWAEYFKTYGFNVGLSVDGPKELHDAQRPRQGGRGSHAAAMRALKLFQEAGVRVGVLVVVTEQTLRLEPDIVFDFLLENGVQSFAFLRLRPESRPDGRYDPQADYLSQERFNTFQRRMFDRWFALDNPQVTIREFVSIVSMLVGGEASICTLAGHCIGRHLGVNVNGDVYHCDRYMTDADYRLGNVHRDAFAAIFNGEKIQLLQARNADRLRGYAGCPWLSICHGGCPHNTYIEQRSITGYDRACCGEAPLIEHIAKRVKSEFISVSATV